MKEHKEILLIDKPSGITSFDVIRQLRKKLGIRKMGHAGTLDPLASGLMIIGVGEGTKKLNDYLKLPKVYVAEILFGMRTDTGDITGEISEEKEIDSLDPQRVSDALGSMVGELQLPVPAYSAIKQGGEALYKKARRGENVEPPIKTMKVISVDFFDISKESGNWVVTARFFVNSGTYIRSLVEELGKRLGYPATLRALRRTQIGNFKIENAEKL